MRYSDMQIERFLEAQQSPFCGYKVALKEVGAGKKLSHWMWYIFPQFRALAYSNRAHYWGVVDRVEAENYLRHHVLGVRLREITTALLEHKGKTSVEIFGEIDARKLRSCMTMFDHISPNDIFGEVLDMFCQGMRCDKTLKIVQQK